MSFIARSKDWLSQASARYWGVIALALWGAAVFAFGLLRLDTHGAEEAGARALLLVWSVGERIASTVVILGLPDLRALLQIPLGAYWPGSMVAAKVYALLITAIAAAMLYRWSRREHGPETALIATGLLLITPITIAQVDALGAGPYLLLVFAVGAWLDRTYRRVQRPLGGWFFLQLLWIMIAVSIHPAAIAYPLALLWQWKIDPIDGRHQRHQYIGITLALIFVLVLRKGWPALHWLGNPLTALSSAVLGQEFQGETLPLLVGITVVAFLVYLLIAERKRLTTEPLTRMLLIGMLIGTLCADGPWAMLCLAVALYFGIARLIAFNQAFGSTGLSGQRGIVLLAIFVASTLFMQAQKAHHQAIVQNLLPPVDQLILTFSVEIEDTDADAAHIVTMSQWPGKTMLATRRPALPLPPPFADSQTLLGKISGVSYLLFNPKQPANTALAAQLAELTGVTETLLLEEGGAVVHFRQSPTESP
ncbi:MAG: hypothetical protein LBV36_06850 [Chromatiales bacterium]|jgi:hypothetical protein|nr:hypothetical protein [Chromatiales bacterium]